jgi:hypothetical protein
MSKFALPCIVCEKPLRNVNEDVDNQPYVGTEFISGGHYGSTIHDEFPPPEGESYMMLVVNICDTCILRAIDAGVIQSRADDLSIALSRHPISERERAWVLAQNEKEYGSAWGKDEPVDYVALMRKSGWTLPLEEEVP